jgi:hypothetical protein
VASSGSSSGSDQLVFDSRGTLVLEDLLAGMDEQVGVMLLPWPPPPPTPMCTHKNAGPGSMQLASPSYGVAARVLSDPFWHRGRAPCCCHTVECGAG